jgi:hypothetical protein
MFDWLFRPSCPCDPAAKEWIEDRLQWLADEFDDHVYNGRPLVLPTPEFFPDPYDGSPVTVRRLFRRVCHFMDVSPELIDLQFIANTPRISIVDESGKALPDGAAGLYEEGEEKFIVRLSKEELDDPMALVGTMAHELAHVRLLGENRIMREIFDNEILTDLTVVHFGLGIFLANSPRNWAGHFSHWPKRDLLKPEYMSPPMFGWALAHIAWFREEEKPSWASYLNSAARSNLKQGIRYLFATGESEYLPSRFRELP